MDTYLLNQPIHLRNRVHQIKVEEIKSNFKSISIFRQNLLSIVILLINFVIAYFGNNFRIFILYISSISCPIMIYILPSFLLIGMQIKEGYTEYKSCFFMSNIIFGTIGLVEMVLFFAFALYVSIAPEVN